jgi:phage terminase large subunit-like protein
VSERKGSETPRIFTPPKRELTPETSYGFSVIEFAEQVLDIKLFPWQKWFFIHALEANPDGSFRFRRIVLLVGRQNGKTTLARILALWCLFVLQVALVLGTAQNLDTSEDTWEGAVEMVENIGELADELARVVRVNGKKSMQLTLGREYKVAASSRKGARGKTGDLVIMDELREHLNWDAWGAVTKTTNARPNALILCMSNAGDAYSVVLRHLRYKAHMALGDPDGWCKSTGDFGTDEEEEPQDDTLGIFEWSAPPNCSKWDREGWAQANPSMGYGTITEKVIAGDAATDKEAVFRTEDLCQWVETIRAEPFPEGAWEAGTDDESRRAQDSEIAFGIDVSGDRTHASIAVAGRRADGGWHVELVAYRTGTTWPLTWLAERAEKYRRRGTPIRIAWQKRGAPVSSMSDELSAIEGIECVEVEGRDIAAWCGRLWDGVAACLPESESDSARVWHRPQPALDMAAHTAATRPLGDAAWAFDRSKSPEDCSPLIACAMALGLLQHPQEDSTVESAYSEDRGILSF